MNHHHESSPHLHSERDLREGDEALLAVDEVLVAEVGGQQSGVAEERQAVVRGEDALAGLKHLHNRLVRLVHPPVKFSQLLEVFLRLENGYQDLEHLQ